MLDEQMTPRGDATGSQLMIPSIALPQSRSSFQLYDADSLTSPGNFSILLNTDDETFAANNNNNNNNNNNCVDNEDIHNTIAEELERIAREGTAEMLLQFVQEHADMDECLAQMDATERYKKFVLRYKFCGQQCSLLHLLCKFKNGHVPDMITCLIEKFGINVNIADKHESTPLFYACASGHTEAAACLLSKGANVNVKDSIGHFPLRIALRNGYTDIVQSLIYAGADVNMTATKGETCLHMLTMKGDLKMLKFLLGPELSVFNSGIHLTARNRHEETALFYSVAHPEVMSLLLETMKSKLSASDFNRSLTHKNALGYNLFHKIAESGNAHSLSILVEHIPDNLIEEMLNEKDFCMHNTPLHIAVLYENVEIVNLYAKCAEIDINMQNKKGDTALHIAFREELPENIVVSILENEYTSVLIPNLENETCLTLLKSYPEVSDQILELVSMCELLHNTPLTSVTSTLLASGDTNKKISKSISFLKKAKGKVIPSDVRKLVNKLRHVQE
jgi:ankyrin repeat protein